jgi:hypothetical protein
VASREVRNPEGLVFSIGLFYTSFISPNTKCK